jgi:O-antigen/teichoic acid export membrane protein
MVFIAVLARQLTPADFGGYTTITSLIWFIGPLADLGISQVLIREIAADRSKARTLLPNALLTVGFLTGIASCLLVAIAALGNYPASLRPLIGISALAVIGYTIMQTANSALRGFERMEIQALLTSSLLLLSSLAGIVAALTGQGLPVQIVILIISSLLGAAIVLTVIHLRFVPIRWALDLPFCWNLITQAVPIFILIAYSVSLRWSDILILGQVRPLSDVAFYGAAQKVIDLAMVFTASASAALFPVLASRWRVSNEDTKRLYTRSLRFFAAFAIAAAIGLTMLAEPIILTLFGPTYFPTALPLKLLAWAFFFQVVSGPMGTLLVAAGDQFKKFVPLIGLVLLGNILLNLTLDPYFGYMGAASAYLVTALAIFLVRQMAATWYFDHPPHLGSIIWKPALAGFGMGTGLFFLRSISIFLSIPIGMIIFISILALSGELKEEPYRGLVALVGTILQPKYRA